MKRFLPIVIAGFAILLASCASKLEIEQPSRVSAPESEFDTSEKMEFIGFDGNSSVLSTRIDYSEHTMYDSQYEGWKYLAESDAIKDFGQSLEDAKIVKKSSIIYTGDYDTPSFDIYETTTRYVTYVQVQKNLWNFGVKSNFFAPGFGLNLVLLGSPLVILTTPLSFVNILGSIVSGCGSIFVLVESNSMTTGISYDGSFNICVFDTREKKIVYEDSVNVTSNDKFKGQYSQNSKDKTNQTAIDNYYATLIHNALLEKYQEVAKKVATFK